jgi:hypothetical protein
MVMVSHRPYLVVGSSALIASLALLVNPIAFAESIADEESDSESRADSTSMFRPVPASLRSFELAAEGTAITKRDGRDGPFIDASINITASAVQEEAEYSRFQAAGAVVLANQKKFDISGAHGTIVFFKDTRGDSIVGMVNIISKHSIDENGNDFGKLRLRALVYDSADGGSWPIAIQPSGRIGHQILLVSTGGTISPR